MDVSQYLEIFLDETNEHLQNLNTQILILEHIQLFNQGLVVIRAFVRALPDIGIVFLKRVIPGDFP